MFLFKEKQNNCSAHFVHRLSARKKEKNRRERRCASEKKENVRLGEREKSVFACVPVPSPVSELSECDLWLWDSQQSLLPVQYCYNWHLMRPDVLSSTALNTGLHLHQSQALFSPPLSLPFIFCIWGGRPRKRGKTRSCCESLQNGEHRWSRSQQAFSPVSTPPPYKPAQWQIKVERTFILMT